VLHPPNLSTSVHARMCADEKLHLMSCKGKYTSLLFTLQPTYAGREHAVAGATQNERDISVRVVGSVCSARWEFAEALSRRAPGPCGSGFERRA
jgi:hypothetical protein